MQSAPVFEVRDLTKEFDGKRVLTLPHLVFERSRMVCLHGTNGSGKTTLFEILTLLQKPTTGSVHYEGREIYPRNEGFAQLREQVTMVQRNPLMFDTTVEKNVGYGLRVRRTPQAQSDRRIDECLKIVGLHGFRERRARELSGGEAQRVAIARALSINPEVLFLDEFSAGIGRSPWRSCVPLCFA